MLEGGSQSYDDVTSTHQADDDAGQGDDWELVIREAHHRMKNTLMLLVASVRTDFRCGRSSQLSAAVDRFERRVVAFGELYQLLSNGADIEAVPVADIFERLCEALSETILEPAAIRCAASIEDGTLSATQCHRLGLIVTELVTNSAKHAFSGRNAGLVRIEAFNRNRCWCFSVTDNGTGAVGLHGTGGRILEGLARSIQAEMRYESDQGGTRVTVVVPALV